MATVPGTPDPPDLIPKELRPTQGDLLIAAGMLHQQGRMQLAGDVIPFPGPSIFEAATRRMGGQVIKDPYPPSKETMRAGLQDLIDAGRLTLTPKDK